MNVKVITRHTPSNYGSLLQSIATIKVVESLGHVCEIIDYRRKDEYGIKSILTDVSRKKAWKHSLIKKWTYIALRYPEETFTQWKFGEMRQKYLRKTQTYHTIDELKKLDADVFMTGSDQVWGPLLNGKYDPIYFLSFVADDKKKVAYAGSFGREEFASQVLTEYKQLLIRYHYLTVREDSAVSLLDKMGVHCDGQVLDPTLLLDKGQWEEYIEKNISGKYVLVYEIHNNPLLDDYAKRFAAYVGLPLIRISPMFHQFIRGGKFVFLPGIGTFLSYIKHATYMLTDSFHGTAFAINFNTQFIEVFPNSETGIRIYSILRQTGLQNRVVNDYDDFSLADSPIDFIQVNEVIAEARKKSFSLLQEMLHF